MTNEFEHNDVASDPEPEPAVTSLSPQPGWLPIGLGLVGVILILVLAWPSLRQQVFTWLGPADASLRELEQAAAADPTNETLQYELAGAYYRAHRFDEAWAQFRVVDAYRSAADAVPEIGEAEQAVQSDPASKVGHFKLGTAWARAQLLPPAEIAFQEAIALDSQYVDAHTNLGVVYYQMGRLPDALSEYDAALSTSPDDADIHHNKGAVFVQQALQTSPPDEGLLDQGLIEFQRALEINSDLAQAHFSLGVVYMMRGQTQEATAEFEQFLELDDGSDPQATDAAQSYLTQLEQ
ncbi:MAG: tetratricopeptide repeat protein [Anaerolineales bacterium]|nr:MAG: tetratricopeptide repeat protein [Anaerolineales bacterium]